MSAHLLTWDGMIRIIYIVNKKEIYKTMTLSSIDMYEYL